MEILLFKTNIDTESKVKELKPLLDKHSDIQEWSVDLYDIDCVLRILSNGKLKEQAVIDCLTTHGFACEILTDQLHESDSNQ